MQGLKNMIRNVFGRKVAETNGEAHGGAGNNNHTDDTSYLTVTSQSSRYEPPLYKNDENQDRGNWSGKLDFLLSMLGWSVGLGNVWRFPYLCYKNGGGVFLIPYFLTMVVVGVPFFYLEVNLGQFSSAGPLTCWQFAPLFKGIGVAMVTLSAIVTVYYNVLVAYSLYFMFASFTSHLPWTDCNNYWNNETCSLKLPLLTQANCTQKDMRFFQNGTCYDSQLRLVAVWNTTVFKNRTGLNRMSPSEEYWNYRVLQKSDGLHEMGGVQWELFGTLLLAWIICFLCLVKGIKTTGKVVYFTALFPYLVLLILFINGLTLEGADIGIKFYITPVWKKLLEAEVWKDAATQVFYSMGMGWGGLIALASYNNFHNNTLRDSLIVPISGCLTSFFAGFVIFSYIGNMAHWMDVEVDQVAKSGAGLAFIVYPEAITHLPAPPFWSFIFFFMLLTLGLDSQFVTVETVLTGICDQFPKTRPKKTYIVALICTVEFILGIPLITKGGFYLFHINDTFVGMMALPFICLLEAIAISYVYGVTRFNQDIQVMTGRSPSLFFIVSWMVLGPGLIVAILLFSWIGYKRLTLGDYDFPVYAEFLGWLIALTPIAGCIVTMVYKVYQEKDAGNIFKRISLLMIPSRMWGPYSVQNRKLITYVPNFVLDPWTEKQELKNHFDNVAFTASSSTIHFSPSTPSRHSHSNSKMSMSNLSQETAI